MDKAVKELMFEVSKDAVELAGKIRLLTMLGIEAQGFADWNTMVRNPYELADVLEKYGQTVAHEIKLMVLEQYLGDEDGEEVGG